MYCKKTLTKYTAPGARIRECEPICVLVRLATAHMVPLNGRKSGTAVWPRQEATLSGTGIRRLSEASHGLMVCESRERPFTDSSPWVDSDV